MRMERVGSLERPTYDPAAPHLVSFARARPAILDGRDSPRAFLERCLEAIEQHEPSVHAFVVMDPEAARKAADESTERYRAGRPLSPVDGCPIGIKDIIDTVDMPTQMNSPIYEGHRPLADAACVWALRQAGCVPVGKTVTTEFACGDSGPTRNPFDLSRTPGGSSSGSAASVGIGMLPVGLGSQTRASTIRPASFCGAYGFKSTYGALNIGGVHPVAYSLDHLGVIAASLADVWTIAMQIAQRVGGLPGHPGLDGPSTLPEPVPVHTLAMLKTPGWDETDPDSRAAFLSMLEGLERRGVNVVSAENDESLAAAEEAMTGSDDLARAIAAFEMRSPMMSYRERHGDAKIGRILHGYLSLSDGMSLDDYRDCLKHQEAMCRVLRDARRDADLFVTLASSGPAPDGLTETGSRNFITPWTLFGGPSLSAPLLGVNGLPLGVQFMGRHGEDATLIGQAAWLSDQVLSRQKQ